MNRKRDSKVLWWLLGGGGALLLLPALCCCGMTVLGAFVPAGPPRSPAPSSPELALPEGEPVPSPVVSPSVEPGPELIAEGGSPAGAAEDPAVALPVEGAAEDAVAEPGLPGIGATRAHWESTHRRAPGFAPGVVFGPMIESAEGEDFGPKYAGVMGDERIYTYALNLPRGTSFEVARMLVRGELPSDAREVRTRRLRACRMIRYRSATMRRQFGSEEHRGDVEIAFFSPSDEVFNPRRVTFATVGFYLGEGIDC